MYSLAIYGINSHFYLNRKLEINIRNRENHFLRERETWRFFRAGRYKFSSSSRNKTEIHFS